MWDEAVAQSRAGEIIRALRNFDEARPILLFVYGLDQEMCFQGRFVIVLSCRSTNALNKDMYMFGARCAINIAAEGLRMMIGGTAVL
jgi:hypothetical protein